MNATLAWTPVAAKATEIESQVKSVPIRQWSWLFAFRMLNLHLQDVGFFFDVHPNTTRGRSSQLFFAGDQR